MSMTPEERFIKIENALQHAAEIQAQHAGNLAQHEDRLTRIEKNLDRHIEFVGTSLARLEAQVAETSKQVNRTAAAQEITEKRMQDLIGKVDGIDSRVDKIEKK
jgi:DNA repair exonuclease SbcCD ATPase subunit